MPLRAPGEHEVLVWFRRAGKAPELITLAPRVSTDRAIRAGVGQLLRRA